MSTFIDSRTINRAGCSTAIAANYSELDMYLGEIFPGPDDPPTNFSFMLIMQTRDRNQSQHLAVYVCTHLSSYDTAISCRAVNNPDWSFSSAMYAQNHVLFTGIPKYDSGWLASFIPLHFE